MHSSGVCSDAFRTLPEHGAKLRHPECGLKEYAEKNSEWVNFPARCQDCHFDVEMSFDFHFDNRDNDNPDNAKQYPADNQLLVLILILTMSFPASDFMPKTHKNFMIPLPSLYVLLRMFAPKTSELCGVTTLPSVLVYQISLFGISSAYATMLIVQSRHSRIVCFSFCIM